MARMPWLGEPTSDTIGAMDLIAAGTALTDRHLEARWAVLAASVADDTEANIVPVVSRSFVLANRYALPAEADLS